MFIVPPISLCYHQGQQRIPNVCRRLTFLRWAVFYISLARAGQGVNDPANFHFQFFELFLQFENGVCKPFLPPRYRAGWT